jgi:hypothetical protein
MVLEADDEVICRSEPFMTGSGGTPHTSEVAALTRRYRAVGRPRYYLVLDDFGGNLGRVWRETAEADANHETLIRDLLDDQYSRPRRIVAFNKSADAGSDTDFLQVSGP